MADVELRFATEAETLARDLIETIDDHKDLADAEIVYLFTSQNPKKADRVVLGKSSKPNALIRFFASGEHQSVQYGPDFILLFSIDQWDKMSDEQRVYLVDHELTHCYKQVTTDKYGEVSEKWALRAHDLEEFRSVVARRGLVMDDAKEFAETVRQLPLENGQAITTRETITVSS